MKPRRTLVTGFGLLVVLPSFASAALIGHWDLDEGAGTTAADASPTGNDATIFDAAWGSDAERGTFLTFTGNDGSYVDAGATTIPALGLADTFSWAFWANRAVGDAEPNSIVFGNRFMPGGGDFAPRQFVKFTPTKFEWHMNGNGNDNTDYPDMVGGEWHHHAVTLDNGVITYYLDGVETSTGAITQALDQPQPLFFGGHDAGGAGEHFNGSMDDVRIYDHALTAQEINDLLAPPTLRPVWSANPLRGTNGTIDTPYTGTLAGEATDPNGVGVTFAKVDGPDWLLVAADGTLSGMPLLANAGANEFTVSAENAEGAITTTLIIRVANPNAPSGLGALFGWWPLNEGAGNLAADISGNGRDLAIVRTDTGGLGPAGEAWIEDPECGPVLSFNGDDATGSYAIMTDGTPGNYGALPLFTTDADNTFSWSLWVKAEDNAANNDIILGNRYAPGGTVDFAPRQFIKFDSNNFEFDTNNVTGVEYDDIVGDQLGVWVHHVVVKDGPDFIYYRNGLEVSTGVVGGSQTDQMPLFFGGQGDFDGVVTNELWHGALSDVRLFTSALSAQDVDFLFNDKGSARPPNRFRFEVSGSGNDLVLKWDSQGGKLYTLRSETDPNLRTVAPGDWPVHVGRMDIVATPPENMLTIPRPADPLRLFVIEEFDAPPVPVFTDDFETGQGGWSVTGSATTAWEFGSPGVPGPPAANSEAFCFGTNLTANYTSDANVALRSPAIDLTGAGGATLNYAEYREIETTFDEGTINVLDAADDSLLAVVQSGIEGDTGGMWQPASKKLPPEALGKLIKIEFVFTSDEFGEFAGWYIDDVQVTVP